jgi:hypothetical protein
VRWALAAAVLAVAGAVYLLVTGGADPAPRPKPPRNGSPIPPENGGNGAPAAGALPDPGAKPEGFVEEAVRRGAVKELLALLRSGDDKQLAPRWSFDAEGRLVGHPTLRACYLAALAGIDTAEATAALQETLTATQSIEETYLVVQALAGRGSPGWAALALQRATGKGSPVQRPLQVRLVQLAAKQDPGRTAQYMAESAPRGEDTSVPRILADGLTALPLEHATSTVETLLADKQVTNQARTLYLKALCAREEVEAIRSLTGLAERRQLDPQTATEACYAAAGARSLDLDRVAEAKALAEGNAAEATKARERRARRRAEIKALIQAALGIDVDTSEDPRAPPLRRLLDRK